MPAIRLHQGLGLFGRHLERKQAGEGLPLPLQT
jgi:CRISPR-associated Cas5-like protein